MKRKQTIERDEIPLAVAAKALLEAQTVDVDRRLDRATPKRREAGLLEKALVVAIPESVLIVTGRVEEPPHSIGVPIEVDARDRRVIRAAVIVVVDDEDVRREGALVNDSADDTSSLTATISVAAQTVNGATGAAVSVPTGISILSSEVTLPNRVRIVGQNKLGSFFQAKSSWNSGTSPWMFHAFNGTSSMFDSLLTDLTIDRNNVAGLGGILSDAWQENSGLRKALILNFATVGVQFQNGFGGASFNKFEDVEIFPGTVNSGSVIGVQVNQMSSSGATFMLDLHNVSIAGGPSAIMLKGVNMVAESLHCRVVHFEECTHGIYLAGSGNHTLIGVTWASTVTN